MLRFSRAAGRPSPISLADRAREARQWDVAVRHYRTALARNPHNPPIWVQYGHALKEGGSYAAAEAAYRRAIADDPTVADTYLQLGRVLKLQDRTEEAKAAYLRGFSMDQSLHEAAGELAAIGCSAEDLPQLLRDIPAPVVGRQTDGLAAGSRRKRGKESVITRADRARDLGQWETAAQLYRQALDRNPGNPPIWVQYGHVLKQSGQLRDAEEAYRQALAYDGRLTDAQLQLGRLLKLRGETEAAQQAFLRAFALDSSLSDVPSELAGLGWSDGRLAALKGLVSTNGSDTSFREARSGVGLVSEHEIGTGLRGRIEASGLFDPATYRSMHEDVRNENVDPWMHFLECGLDEGRRFTTPEIVARRLTQLAPELSRQADRFRAEAARAARPDDDRPDIANLLRQKGVRIGVYCSTEGNFFMEEIANLFTWGLREQRIDVVQRDEGADLDETFDLRVFVAPQEFFTLGRGKDWLPAISRANTVLYNVDQPQSPWFCRAVPLLLRAPLVLDINFQSAEILRGAGCNVVHFMPGYIPQTSYTQAYADVSSLDLLRGYDFARRPYNWRDRNILEERPIDVLFIGTTLDRRAEVLARMEQISDKHRFVCVSTPERDPVRTRDRHIASTERNCALGQRAKIMLNIHRDWLGYFEWSRMVLQGFWQGACVVSDPCLPHPIFEPGVHYLEESVRHIGELTGWLLETHDGRAELDRIRLAGHRNSMTLGSMRVALKPVLEAFGALLPIPLPAATPEAAERPKSLRPQAASAA